MNNELLSVESVIQELEKKWNEIKTEKEQFINNFNESNSVKLNLTVSSYDKKMENVLKEIVIIDEIVDGKRKENFQKINESFENGIPVNKMFMVSSS